MTTETLPVPVETVTPIKPSEAIRLGCLIAPVQAFEDYGNPHEQSACAVGAAHLGWGGDRTTFLHADIAHDRLGDATEDLLDCPACPDVMTIVHLNDTHRWSRERIADWLAEQGL